jgi:23S rRNA pseudouridine1911/1915/1917 synthase
MECGESTRPGIVHRLVKDTSVVMVIARHPDPGLAHRQFKRGAVHKAYVALVVGCIDKPGTVDGAIGRHPIHRKRMALVPSGKPARTDYRPLEALGEYTLVEARPVTGRTHQIRVYLASNAIRSPRQTTALADPGVRSPPHLARLFLTPVAVTLSAT